HFQLFRSSLELRRARSIARGSTRGNAAQAASRPHQPFQIREQEDRLLHRFET
ncbi:hypothetical protein LTS09_016134, partial [Friedmanniomyces endolithicus]